MVGNNGERYGYINRQTWCRRAAAFALWRRVYPCSFVSLVGANANFWPCRCSLARPRVVGARRWDSGMGKTNDAGRRYERESRTPHNRHRHIWSVSLLPQSSLPCPNAPLFRPHLYLGLTLAFNTWWGIVVLVPVLIIMHRGVVLREERYLEHKFGETYRQYRSKVRRYL